MPGCKLSPKQRIDVVVKPGSFETNYRLLNPMIPSNIAIQAQWNGCQRLTNGVWRVFLPPIHLLSQ